MDYFHLSAPKQDLLNMSSLGFAYLGDAVYEVMVRAWLCLHGKLTPGRQHKAALAYVAAPKAGRPVGAHPPPAHPGGGPGPEAGAERQPPLLPQGGHPPGVPGGHRAGDPVRLALPPGGDRPAQYTL